MTAVIEERVLEARPPDFKRGVPLLVAAVLLGDNEVRYLAANPHVIYRLPLLFIAVSVAIICVWKLFFFRAAAEKLRLTVNAGGFGRAGEFYRWDEIHEFGVQKDFRTAFTFFRDNKKVYWTFGESGLADLSADDYALDAAELAALLNDGLYRATGRDRKVYDGPKFPGQLLRPTIFYIRNYLFLISVALWLTLRWLPFYR